MKEDKFEHQMAILNSIRKRGIFLILIIALALFAFILSDVLTKGSTGTKGQDTMATVNGTDISRQSFMEEVEATQRNMAKLQFFTSSKYGLGKRASPCNYGGAN